MRTESTPDIHIRENRDMINFLQLGLVTPLLDPLSTWSNFHPSPKIIDVDRNKYFKFANCLFSLFDVPLVRGLRGEEA